MTFHPATLDSQSPAVQFEELLKALDNLELDLGIVFTRPNSDANRAEDFRFDRHLCGGALECPRFQFVGPGDLSKSDGAG